MQSHFQNKDKATRYFEELKQHHATSFIDRNSPLSHNRKVNVEPSDIGLMFLAALYTLGSRGVMRHFNMDSVTLLSCIEGKHSYLGSDLVMKYLDFAEPYGLDKLPGSLEPPQFKTPTIEDVIKAMHGKQLANLTPVYEAILKSKDSLTSVELRKRFPTINVWNYEKHLYNLGLIQETSIVGKRWQSSKLITPMRFDISPADLQYLVEHGKSYGPYMTPEKVKTGEIIRRIATDHRLVKIMELKEQILSTRSINGDNFYSDAWRMLTGMELTGNFDIKKVDFISARLKFRTQ